MRTEHCSPPSWGRSRTPRGSCSTCRASPPARTSILGDTSYRVERIGRSFLGQPMPAADVYLLKHILPDWNDGVCATILKNIRAGMKPDSRLLVIEFLIPDEIGPGPAPWMDLNMMVNIDGKERTVAEYTALFEACGLLERPPGPTDAMERLFDDRALGPPPRGPAPRGAE